MAAPGCQSCRDPGALGCEGVQGLWDVRGSRVRTPVGSVGDKAEVFYLNRYNILSVHGRKLSSRTVTALCQVINKATINTFKVQER